MEAYVARTQFTRFTERTICDRAMFLKELEAIRERGYAVMNEEMAAHLVGVAAPVFNKEGVSALRRERRRAVLPAR